METHMESETQGTYFQASFAYDTLCPLARHYLKKFYANELLSPLEACRSLMEDAKGNVLFALMQVECYLILED